MVYYNIALIFRVLTSFDLGGVSVPVDPRSLSTSLRPVLLELLKSLDVCTVLLVEVLTAGADIERS